MTKHSGSPDLTRLSGEQAEDRTAREGRIQAAREFLEQEGHSPDADIPLLGTFKSRDVAYLLDAYAEPECSRLASRVEELLSQRADLQQDVKVLEAKRDRAEIRVTELEDKLAQANATTYRLENLVDEIKDAKKKELR